MKVHSHAGAALHRARPLRSRRCSRARSRTGSTLHRAVGRPARGPDPAARRACTRRRRSSDKLVGEAACRSAYYYTDLPLLALWGDAVRSTASSPIDDYFERRARRARCPNVVAVDPGLRRRPAAPTTTRTATSASGSGSSARCSRPSRSRRSGSAALFILTYDEWGGFFDHVTPPIVPDDRASADQRQDFGQAGFRVRRCSSSPYARPGSTTSGATTSSGTERSSPSSACAGSGHSRSGHPLLVSRTPAGGCQSPPLQAHSEHPDGDNWEPPRLANRPETREERVPMADAHSRIRSDQCGRTRR